MLNSFTCRRLVLGVVLLTGLVLAGVPSAVAQTPTLTAAVRAAIAKQDFAGAEQLVANDRKARGVTPDGLEAMSWLGRGALAAERWDAADTYARDTYALAIAALKGRTMDQEPRLPIAIASTLTWSAGMITSTNTMLLSGSAIPTISSFSSTSATVAAP